MVILSNYGGGQAELQQDDKNGYTLQQIAASVFNRLLQPSTSW
jgi:hypothetical protein